LEKIFIMENQVLNFDVIKLLYPDEWILVGNPDLGEPNKAGSVMKKLISGVVLLHSKNKLELAQQAKTARSNYESVTLVFTGEIPKNRKFWL
jgi:hypothetical protein